jgi:hypothetical protein
MTFKIRINTFSLALGLFSIVVLSLLLLLFDDYHQTIIPITAQPSAENTNKKEDKKDDSSDGLTIIKTKINLNNIDVKNHDQLKLVSYLNGEGKITYIDLKESKNKINPKDNSLTVDLKFNKSNDISQVMFDDEYYVCGYVIDEKINTANTKSNLTLYDCDEGNISLTSTDKDTVKLFYTLKKFSESNALYNTNNPSTTKETPKEVKLRIDVPIHDNKKINDMYVVAMIKGEYQIKTIDAQQEIEKGGNKKSTGERLSIPFTFDRKTEVGIIEPGDMFFGCVTSDEFPDQNSDCEKRIITDLSKPGQVCARKDSACK